MRHAPAHRFYKHSVPTGRWSHDLSIRVACEYLVPILFTPIGDQRKDPVPEGPNVCSRTVKVITRPVGTQCLTRHGYFNFTPNDVSTKSKNQKSIIPNRKSSGTLPNDHAGFYKHCVPTGRGMPQHTVSTHIASLQAAVPSTSLSLSLVSIWYRSYSLQSVINAKTWSQRD